MSEPTIKVDLTVPEGLPKLSVTVACKPLNQAEHDAIVDACGGPCAFHYFSDYGSHAKLSENVTLIMEAYDAVPRHSMPIPHSVAKLKEACPR
jgi:hypothetical protein